MFKNLFLLFVFLLFNTLVFAQDETPQIDASKPTNFYSFIDNTLEYSQRPNANVFGYRGNVTLALSEAHLLLAELPLLYNDATKKFGIGDIRARYFWLPYKNYDKVLGAFGPSIDVFAPTGNVDDGIGSGSWVLSPGVTVGLMAADWIQFFPILSYQFVSKSNTTMVPEDQKMESHGITFQVLIPIVISDKFFLQVTPIYRRNNFNDVRRDRYIQELFANYALKEKLQLTAFFSGNFKDELYVYRLGLTIFF